jgi:hypothetical protein
VDPLKSLRELERLATEFGGGVAAARLSSLRALARAKLPTARDVRRLHEVLCFLHAYPDDARVLAQVRRMLGAFARRRDLARHRRALENSGIAGTPIRFRFFAPMAGWLARHWPGHLTVDWPELDQAELLEHLLPLMVHYGETPALDEFDFPLRRWVERLKGPAETDAAFLVRRFERLKMDAAAREILYDELDPTLVLSPGPGTPARTDARHPRSPVAFQRRPLDRGRPDLRQAIAAARPRVRDVSRLEGRSLVDLAREAMVTRERDLDAFSNADERDVRLVDLGEGLQFACIGVVPEQRLMLETVYGYLTLKNGVPIGYVLSAALFGSAEVAYNVFETYRGAEASRVYAGVLAMIHHLFGTDTFMVPPYQLGEGNDEALASGAWWFYQKLGFHPRRPATRALMRRELARMGRNPSHRSSLRTLEKLSSTNLYFDLGRPRQDVLGRLGLANVGLHVSRYLARRFGSDRERGAEVCAAEAADLLGMRSARLTTGERVAWERWSPLVLILPGVRRWTSAERHALAAIVRLKGGRRESDFAQAFDRHARLRAAVARLATAPES